MSRSNLPKSRTEKSKAASATPAVAHEIIPGKYNDQDWNLMLDHDDGDEFISDIVEEICGSAMDVIYENYIQRQLVPYTVCQAKDAILQIIEWQFLSRDEGELNVEADAGWIQDEEPEPAVTDCWAQGSVPKVKVPVTPRTPVTSIMEDEEPTPLEEITESPAHELQDIEEEDEKIQEEATGEDSIPVEEDEDEEDEEKQTEVKKEEKPKKKKYKRHVGRLPSAGLSKMTESLEDTEIKMLMQEKSASYPVKTPDPDSLQMPASCHSIIKFQSGRPPGNRDVLFDEKGNVISVFKIDPEKLPNHKIRTGYRIIDPAVEEAQARLHAMKTGKYVATQKHAPKPPATGKSSMSRSRQYTSKSGAAANAEPESKAYDVVPLPPPVIELVDVAPGVVMKEGDRLKRGPRQHNKKMEAVLGALQKTLRPIPSRANVPTLTVAEILEHQTPVVKPLVDNTPIPPITKQTFAC